MIEVIEIPSFGEIIRQNVVQAIEAVFLTYPYSISGDHYILASKNTMSLCNLMYTKGDLSRLIYKMIRVCDRLGDNEVELIRIIDFDNLPLLVAKIATT